MSLNSAEQVPVPLAGISSSTFPSKCYRERERVRARWREGKKRTDEERARFVLPQETSA